MLMETLLVYLFKNIVCAGILLLYYWLALRNKQFHYYNRFYLLSSIVISLVVPLLHFQWWQVQSNDADIARLLQLLNNNRPAATAPAPARQPDAGSLLLLLFGAWCLLLLLMQVLRISQLFRLRSRYPQEMLEGIRFINTDLPQAPFSFLNNLFWRSDLPLTDATCRQIFRHELTHIRQKHSYDKLFVQLVLCLYWMNPFYYLMRRELQMIHEFIADEKAVTGKDSAAFAAMLLRSQGSHFNFQPAIPFFYSPIKRRLFMLTNPRKPRYSYIRRLMLLPLLALVTGLFAFTLAHQEHAGNATAATPFTDTTKNKSGQATLANQAGSDTPKAKTYIIELKEYDKGPAQSKVKQITLHNDALTLSSDKIIFGNSQSVFSKDTLVGIHTIQPVNPMFIVDGVQVNNISHINPSNIESISILKNQAAIAIYGEGAKEGVVLITTKNSSKAKAQLDSTKALK